MPYNGAYLKQGLDVQVRNVLGTLLDVLSTPSGQVQRAVSDCLPPLMPSIRSDRAYTEGMLQRLLDMLLKGDSYGIRCVLLSMQGIPQFLLGWACCRSVQGGSHNLSDVLQLPAGANGLS